jgi:hypothetical protein
MLVPVCAVAQLQWAMVAAAHGWWNGGAIAECGATIPMLLAAVMGVSGQRG